MSHPPEDQAKIADYAGQIIQKSSHVHLNLGQNIVFTTEDKIRICLMNHLGQVEHKKGWIAPLGIAVAIAVAFVTTKFQDSLYLSADTWKAIFIVAGVIVAGWLIKAIWKAICSRSSINAVIEEIKKSAIQSGASLPLGVGAGGGASPVVSDVLEIEKAFYGAGAKGADVAERLRQRISDGKIIMLVTNNNMGGDPLKGVNKMLQVTYVCGGYRKSVEVPEGQSLVLPLPE